MKRSIISVLAIAATAFAISACGAGMHSQTARMVAPVPGIWKDAPGKDNLGTVSLRNAALVYPGPQGYPSGAEATVQAWLFNDTPVEQVVVVRSQGQEFKRVTIAPGSFARIEPKFRLNQSVGTADTLPVIFEWVGVNTMETQLPVAPPRSPVPGEKIELPATPAEGH